MPDAPDSPVLFECRRYRSCLLESLLNQLAVAMFVFLSRTARAGLIPPDLAALPHVGLRDRGRRVRRRRA